jgi:HD-GYP domain-containing protein (c-di-GMP phosphodiesterase class II)/predicted MFS family arabinose efflux permease
MPAKLPSFRHLQLPAQLYVGGIILAGVILTALGWLLHPVTPDAIPTLLYLAVVTQIGALLPIRWKAGMQTVSDPLLVATGLYAPGGGVGLIAWLALFDGRVPGRTLAWWAFFFNRAMVACTHVIPSLLVTEITGPGWLTLPLRAVVYVVITVSLNYVMTARVLSYANRSSFLEMLSQNVGASTLGSTIVLGFSGGILYLLLKAGLVGYIMAPGLFGFVLAVRGNVADAQRQGELKNQTLDLAAQALDARDRYTESHSIRVSELAGRLGEQLELGDRECELIRTAGSLHDLGKIGVRDDILNKPGPLTEEEWEVMRRHPDIAADMIAQHSALMEVAPLVRHHHERWDGTGYPAGLKRDVIPFGARILAVADSFDTITGPRLYRQSLMTPLEGVEDISRRADHWYDPNVVDALRELHNLKPLDLANRSQVPRRISSLRVLRANPTFGNLLTAIGISSIGDPLTQVATLVLIYMSTGRDARTVALAFVAQAVATIVMSSVLGGAADKLPRKPLIVTLELSRAAVLIATPAIVSLHWWLIIPMLFALACINAVVQPARQAAIPLVVPAGQVGKANAMVAGTNMLAGAIGFALAGAILTLFPLMVLFFVDAATFILAAAIILGIPSLGGGSIAAPVSGALRRTWRIASARPQLVIGTLAAFLIPISYPALLALAYRISSSGGQTYSVLEVVLSVGVLAGTLAVSRFGSIGSMRTVGAGLFLTGVFSIVIAMSSSPLMIAAALFLASIGNPIYSVANQTALMEAADASNRGSVMATRFGLVQTASIAGAAAGGFIVSAFGPSGPFVAYGVLGVGLVLLAMYALAAGRSSVNPILGADYEEAQVKATAAQQPGRVT